MKFITEGEYDARILQQVPIGGYMVVKNNGELVYTLNEVVTVEVAQNAYESSFALVNICTIVGIGDQYFNRDGKYLGFDNEGNGKVKIISQSVWDANKSINSDGTETIDHRIGIEESVLFSKSNMSIDQVLAVYQHYNPTDLPLRQHRNDDGVGSGMTFTINKINNNYEIFIAIKLQGLMNSNDLRISDHIFEIINMFVHENKHYQDYNNFGLEDYLLIDNFDIEQRAITAQMLHESWEKTRPEYKQRIKNFGYNNRMPFPIKPKKFYLQNSY